jgi:glycosyltransferase involved in cell wall biosynthesis
LRVEVLDEALGDLPHTPMGDSEPRIAMTLIVAAGHAGPALRERVDAFMRLTTAQPTEIVVACEAPWSDPPPGVRVVVTGPVSRGDKLDLASEDARGEVLAFVQEDVCLSEEWQSRAFELLRNPAVGAVGGPQVLPSGATAGQRAAWMILNSVLGSGPLRYRFRRRAARAVPEMPTTNLVVRREAFMAVGGFQCPSPLGDDARLCYKVRSLLGLQVVYDPSLAVETAPPAFLQPFASLIFQWGRQRGDLARRLPETSRQFPYVLPALALLTCLLITILAPFTPAARLGLVLLAGAYFLGGAWLLFRSRYLRSGVLAAVGLPLAHLAYGTGFLRGYLGRSMGELSPGRFQRKPLRILIFNWRDITHPWAGGAEAYMHELGRRWVRSGCDVGWVSERYRVGKRVEVIDGIRFHRVGGRFTLYPFAALAYLVRLRGRYDVIVDCENGIPFFSPIYTRKSVVLLVFHLHSEVFRRELPAPFRWLALWLENWLMPRVYRNSRVVTISASTLGELQAKGYQESRLTVVTPGVEIRDATLPAERSNDPLLVYLGRLKRYKSVDILLRAMPGVLARYPRAKLSIVGQGPEREKLERLAWSLGIMASVRFHGYLESRAKEEMLARSWVVVCPSQFEGWGIVCLEASAHGIPVVAARVAGLKDAVEDGVTGVLVPYGDSVRLEKEIVGLLADPAQRQMMGDAGRIWAAQHDWNVSAELFLRTLAELASGPRRQSFLAPAKPARVRR